MRVPWLTTKVIWPLDAIEDARRLARKFGAQHWVGDVAEPFRLAVMDPFVEEYGRGIRARMRRGENPLRACAELMRRNQRRYGGYVVHLGIVLMFVGFAGSAFDLETTKLLRPDLPVMARPVRTTRRWRRRRPGR